MIVRTDVIITELFISQILFGNNSILLKIKKTLSQASRHGHNCHTLGVHTAVHFHGQETGKMVFITLAPASRRGLQTHGTDAMRQL